MLERPQQRDLVLECVSVRRWREERRWAANALYGKLLEAWRSWCPAWDLVESVASRCDPYTQSIVRILERYWALADADDEVMEADEYVDDEAIVHVATSSREALEILEKLEADMTLIDSVQVQGGNTLCHCMSRASTGRVVERGSKLRRCIDAAGVELRQDNLQQLVLPLTFYFEVGRSKSPRNMNPNERLAFYCRRQPAI